MRLAELKDQVLDSQVETFVLTNISTFVKDFILGFAYLGKSTHSGVIPEIEVVTSVKCTHAEFLNTRDKEGFKFDALNFFNKYTGSIEIVRNGTTELVYFPMLPYAEALGDEQKHEWMQSLPVGKPRAKIDSFLEGSLDYIQQLKNEYMFKKTFSFYPVFGAITKQIPLWRSFALYVVSLFLRQPAQ